MGEHEDERAELAADRDAWMARAVALQLQLDARTAPSGDASLVDSDKARAFFARWGLVAHPDPEFRTGQSQADAMAALAQVLADERGSLPIVWVREPREDADRWAQLARRAVGVVSELQRLDGEVASVLDAYAAVGGDAARRTAARLERCPVSITGPIGGRLRCTRAAHPDDPMGHLWEGR